MAVGLLYLKSEVIFLNSVAVNMVFFIVFSYFLVQRRVLKNQLIPNTLVRSFLFNTKRVFIS